VQDGGIKANQEAIMKATAEHSVLSDAIHDNTIALGQLQIVLERLPSKR
jgi:hypothetical protein